MKKIKISHLSALIVILASGIHACGPVTPVSVDDYPTSIPPTSVSPIDPSLESINKENIDALEQIGRLGTGRVTGYALSPDKSKIALYIHDKIKVYDTETLDEELTITTRRYESKSDMHHNTWSIIRFAQDGKTLAFTDGYWVSLWDTSTNQRLGWFPTIIPDWDVVDIGFSPDSQRLVLTTWGSSSRCDGRDMNFALYGNTGKLLFDQYSCADYARYYYKFVSDDKVYISFSSIMTDKFPSRFYLVNTQTGNLIEFSEYDFDKDPSITQEVLYDVSPDGKILAYVVYGSEKPSTKLIDYSTRKTIDTLEGIIEFVMVDGNITWQSQIPVNPVQEEQGTISSRCGLKNVHSFDNYEELFVSQNKMALLLVTHFGEFAYLDLFDLKSCQTVKRISFSASKSAIFSPDGRWLATSDGFNAYIWDVRDRTLHVSIIGGPFTGPKDILRFNSDGTRLLVSSFGRDYINPDQPYRNYDVSVFDVETGNLAKQIKPESEFLYSIASTPRKEIIMAYDSEGFHFWNIETGQLISTIPSGAYVFNPNSEQIWVAPRDRAVKPSAGKILVYDYITGKVIREFANTPVFWIRGLYLNGDNTKIMVHLFLGQEKENGDAISVFDIESGKQLTSYHLPGNDYELTAYGDSFATNGTEGYVHLWNYENENLVRTLSVSHKNRKISDNYDDFFDFGDYLDARFYGENILYTKSDVFRFWDTSNGTVLTEMKPDYAIEDLVFNPDRSLIAAIGKDGIIRLWGVPRK